MNHISLSLRKKERGEEEKEEEGEGEEEERPLFTVFQQLKIHINFLNCQKFDGT